MRHPDLDEMIMMERRRDDLAEAAHYRMLREAERGKRLSRGRSQPAILRRLSESLLLWLANLLLLVGEQMLSWSCRLQAAFPARVTGCPGTPPPPPRS